MEYIPAASELAWYVATPPESVPVPRADVPLLKVTVSPSALCPWLDAGLNLAVRVTGFP